MGYSFIKRLAGRPLATLLIWCLRLTGRKLGIAVMYHGIDTRQGDPEAELVPSVEQRTFARQVRYLRRHYRCVAPEALADAVAARQRGRRFPVALTFDDDLRQHVDYALPILRDAGVPATFFLTGASLANPQSTWWERLQRATALGHTPESVAQLLPGPIDDMSNAGVIDIHLLGLAVEHLTPRQRRRFAQRLLERAGPDPVDAGLSAEAVAQLAAAGFGIGFHTRDHDTLTGLEDAELKRRIQVGRTELSVAAGKPISAIAYPHGHADARVANAAKQANFRVGYTGKRAAVSPASDPLLLGRCDTVALGASLGELAIGLAVTLLRDPDGS